MLASPRYVHFTPGNGYPADRLACPLNANSENQKVRLTHARSGRSVVIRINDRGQFVHGRVINVKQAAARALGFSGLAPVTLDVIHQLRMIFQSMTLGTLRARTACTRSPV